MPSIRRAGSGGRDVEFTQLSAGLKDPAAKPMGALELSATEARHGKELYSGVSLCRVWDMDHIKERMSCPVHLHRIHCELHGPAWPVLLS